MPRTELRPASTPADLSSAVPRTTGPGHHRGIRGPEFAERGDAASRSDCVGAAEFEKEQQNRPPSCCRRHRPIMIRRGTIMLHEPPTEMLCTTADVQGSPVQRVG
jgi:hypothetical protein